MTQSKKPSPIIKLSLLGMAFLALMQGYNSTKGVNQFIEALPVEGTAPASQDAKPAAPPSIDRNLVPLLAESRKKRAEVNLTASAGFAESENMEQLFGRAVPVRVKPGAAAASAPAPARAVSTPEELAAAEPPKPLLVDYFKVLPSFVQLQAITSQGAVVNGRLYAQGEPVTSLSYPSPDGTKTLNPKLVSIERDAIVLGDAGSDRTHRVALLAEKAVANSK